MDITQQTRQFESIPATESDSLIEPVSLLAQAGLDVGMNMADFGVGRTAIFTLSAAKMVTESGSVYALDVVKDILAIVDQKAENAGIHNVHTVWTDLEMYGAAKRIVDGVLDVGVFSDTLFMSSSIDAMMKEAFRMIRSGGRLLVVDWKTGRTPIGPPPENRVSLAEVQPAAEQAGFQYTKDLIAGEYHWGALFTK